MTVMENERVQAAIRRCARADAWLKLETNESRKEQARQELVTAKEALQAAIKQAAQTKVVAQDGPTHVREIKKRG